MTKGYSPKQEAHDFSYGKFTYDVISIGNATQDVFVEISPKHAKKDVCFVPGHKIEIKGMHYHTGGGASNTSAAFSKMGLKAAIVSELGNDPAGKAIEEELKEYGIGRELLIRSKVKTAYSVILTGFGKDRVILAYSGATACLKDKDIKWNKINAKWVHVSSLHKKPKLMEKICVHAKKRGAMVSINPGKTELSAGLKKLEKTFRNADVLFLNESEALSLTGSANIERNLGLLHNYCNKIVITAGAKGAYVYDGKTVYFKDIFPVTVTDATGCGDAFNSGFVAALIYGKSTEEALLWGSAQSNSIVTKIGTKNILLNKRQINKFLDSFTNGRKVVKKKM